VPHRYGSEQSPEPEEELEVGADALDVYVEVLGAEVVVSLTLVVTLTEEDTC